MERDSRNFRGRVLVPAITYFGIVFATGFVLGAFRVTFVVPRLGVRYAELLEMPLMLVTTVLAARYVARRFSLPFQTRSRASIGALAFAFLVGAEIALVYLLQGLTITSYLSSRDPISGSAYAAMLALFGVMPLLVARRPNPSLERP